VPYFFILPGFVLYVAAMSIALALTSVYRPVAFLRPHLASVLLWSSLGFVVSTVAYAVVMVASVHAMGLVLGGKPSVPGGIAMAGIVFVGPFVASAVGLLGGAAFGARRIRRRRKE
jgi:hypothetical protein